jgi:hypothetical protein
MHLVILHPTLNSSRAPHGLSGLEDLVSSGEIEVEIVSTASLPTMMTVSTNGAGDIRPVQCGLARAMPNYFTRMVPVMNGCMEQW